jgi:hypothetical protein
MSWHIYSPSYRRSDVAITHKLFPPGRFTYVVREEEYHLYEKLGVDVLSIPPGSVKDIASTRNWILNNKKHKYIIMVDDDIKAFYWIYKRNKISLNPEKLCEQLENGFQLGIDSKSGVWGMNLQTDPMMYRISTPFSFNSPVLGPFVGIIDDSLRYDESLPLKEDYDFFLQQLRKHRKALRVNYLSYDADHLKLKGGCQSYRSDELEKSQNELLIKKWGNSIIDFNPRNPDSINLVIKKIL